MTFFNSFPNFAQSAPLCEMELKMIIFDLIPLIDAEMKSLLLYYINITLILLKLAFFSVVVPLILPNTAFLSIELQIRNVMSAQFYLNQHFYRSYDLISKKDFVFLLI